MRQIKPNSLKTRILSGFLSLVMVVSACPVTAFATEVDTGPSDTTTKTTLVVDEDGIHINNENPDYTITTEESNSEEKTVVEETKTETSEELPNDEVTAETEEKSEVTDTETDTEIKESEEEIVEETTDEEQPIFEYSVTLPEDEAVSEGDTLTVEATIVATKSLGDETTDVEYRFEFSSDENVSINMDSETSATLTFNKRGEHIIVGKLFVEEEEVASDEMIVNVAPVVVFDHCFSDIDETLIETSDLFVKSHTKSVFTKNTNVVSNFDDVYIIECESVEQARYVYSYYVDKVEFISDLSNVISIATDENENDVADLEDVNEGNDVITQLNDIVEETSEDDYSDFIALIDTGADADVNFSVVGDNTSDLNGHGTLMLELIKNENPDAKVMSIKVFDGDSTNAASVYAGIKLAIENNVKIINLSLVGANVKKNEIVKDVIQEAIDKGIVVIGAAGNNNLNANKFIPGCVEDAIIIGAVDKNGVKLPNSNYNSDYYVVADSTSEATAIFTGLYSANITSDTRLFDGDFKPTEIEKPEELPEGYEWVKEGIKDSVYDYKINEDGSVTFFIDILRNPNFVPAYGTSVPHGSGNQVQIPALSGASAGTTTSSGTCSFTMERPGEGKASNFSGNGIFEQVWRADGSNPIYCSCERYWNGDGDQSAHANYLRSGTLNYQATSTVSYTDGGAKAQLQVDIRFSQSGSYTVNWSPKSQTHDLKVTVDTSTIGAYDPDQQPVKIYAYLDGSNVSSFSSVIKKGDQSALNAEVNKGKAAVNDEVQKKVNALQPDDFSGNRKITKNIGSWSNSMENGYDTYKATATISYEHTDDYQIYHGVYDAWAYRYVYLTINKTASAPKKYGNSYNFGDDTKLYVYKGGADVYDVNGTRVMFDPDSPGNSQEFALSYDQYANQTVTMVETSVGFGYRYGSQSERTATTTLGGGGSHNTISINNRPMDDPLDFRIRKISDTSESGRWNGDIIPTGATYNLTGYAVNTNCEKTGGVVWNKNYTTNSDGILTIRDEELPIGYYELRETVVPTQNGHGTGLLRNDRVYAIYILPLGTEPGNNHGQAYHTSTNTSVFIYECKDGQTGRNGTPIARRDGAGSAWIRPQYTQDGITVTLPTDNDIYYQIEEEVWRPLGVLKADTDLDETNNTSNAVLGIAEGKGAYVNAKYQLFSTVNTANFFDETYKTQNGGKRLSFGGGMTSIATTDGLGNAGTTNFGSTLYPVLVDGQNIIVTTNENGYAKTDVNFPYSDKYRWVEIQAPEGYEINTHVYAINASDWHNGSDGRTNQKLDTYTDTQDVILYLLLKKGNHRLNTFY